MWWKYMGQKRHSADMKFYWTVSITHSETVAFFAATSAFRSQHERLTSLTEQSGLPKDIQNSAQV